MTTVGAEATEMTMIITIKEPVWFTHPDGIGVC